MVWNGMMRRRREREDVLWRLRQDHPEAGPADVEPAEAASRARPRRRLHIAVLLLIGLSILVQAIPSEEERGRPAKGSPRYTFEIPPSWERTPDSELPPTTLADVRAIERGEDGILIGSFRPVARQRVLRSMREQWTAADAEVVAQRSRRVAGSDAMQFDVAKPGIRDRTTVVFASAFVAYWVKCISRSDHRATRRACRKVLRTFELRPPKS